MPLVVRYDLRPDERVTELLVLLEGGPSLLLRSEDGLFSWPAIPMEQVQPLADLADGVAALERFLVLTQQTVSGLTVGGPAEPFCIQLETVPGPVVSLKIEVGGEVVVDQVADVAANTLTLRVRPAVPDVSYARSRLTAHVLRLFADAVALAVVET